VAGSSKGWNKTREAATVDARGKGDEVCNRLSSNDTYRGSVQASKKYILQTVRWVRKQRKRRRGGKKGGFKSCRSSKQKTE